MAKTKTKFIVVIGYEAYRIEKFIQNNISSYVLELKPDSSPEFCYDNALVEMFPETKIHPRYHSDIADEIFDNSSNKKFVIIVIMIIINCRIIDQIQFQSIASQFSKIC